MRRVLRLIALLRRHERLVVAAVLGLGVAAMIAHWWGTARLPPPGAAQHAPAAHDTPHAEAPRAARAELSEAH